MLRKDIDRSTVPLSPGVYKFLSKGNRILYIGKAKSLRKRLQQYFSPGSLWKQDMVRKARRVEWLPVATDQEALLLEVNLINTYRPFYNNLIRGDTSYVYIKIPQEPFPEISLTRYRKNDGAIYIGPKVWKRDLRQLLQMIRYLFQRRACAPQVFKKGIVCSDYFFGLCKGRCAYHALEQGSQDINTKIGFTPVMTPEEAAHDYEALIKILGYFFTGHHTPLQKILKEHIDHAVSQEHFERAGKLRDMYHMVAAITEKQTVAFERHVSGLFVTASTKDDTLFWVIITLGEGRIIDVLTGHDSLEDLDQALLLDAIAREFQVKLEPSRFFENTWTATDEVLLKKHQQFLQTHAENFLQGYQASRLEQDRRAHQMELLEELKQTYHFRTTPLHMECIDISHFHGDNTVGGLSALYEGKLLKSLYRRYKIRGTARHDDYAALKEVLQRRYATAERDNTFPQVCVIDGGKGQLHVVYELVQSDPKRRDYITKTTFVALGKGEARTRQGKLSGTGEILYTFDTEWSIQEIPLSYSEADRLLITLRDEAHRFANTYRKKLSSFDYNDSNQ